MGIFDNIFGDCGGLLDEVFAMKDWQEKLNKLYWTDSIEYLRRLNDIKSKGYKVLRNSKCKHKIEVRY
jgi:hypothetical protein